MRLLLLLLLLSGLAWAQETPAAPVFSGKYEVYDDTVQGFRLKVPVEFKLQNKGATTDWLGPQVDGFATTIFVNVVPMPGIHPQALYDGVIRAKKADKTVTEVVPVKMPGKFKGKPAFAFRCKEIVFKPGTKDVKDATDFHRWFLYVWGNDSAYELALCGSYQNLHQGKELPKVYEEVLKSFSLR